MIIGGSIPSALSSLITSNPFISGIVRSSMIDEKPPEDAFSIALEPSSAYSTAYPAFWRLLPRTHLILSSSSTTNIFLFIFSV